MAQSTRELIQTGDLNHDGQPEIIAGYRTSQGSAGVLILTGIKQGQWRKLWQEEGGYSLERLQLTDITGDGRDELLIGWAIGASAGNGLDILAWQDGNLKKLPAQVTTAWKWRTWPVKKVKTAGRNWPSGSRTPVTPWP
ncbi:FG-GAP repeat domain-containing protein [Desulfofundulus thermosubterraneus]|uniref:FG-GAP repeat domain-containing protein n=1 Tax=Desulfofundulus thermosubterraneus TaxID=348840 RepID=UPI001041D30B|nr:VCBS repeat-containing protein [Desulfofundulus thermosubterraneus]